MNFKEIERKFLLKTSPVIPATCYLDYFVNQGYVPGELIKERLTLVHVEHLKYLRDVKIGSGIERLEFEEEISQELFDSMWPLTEGRRVWKRRFCVPAENDLVWEVDFFMDRELYLAEIEIPSVDYPVTLPEWIEPLVVREVTGEKEFEGFYMGI